MKTTIFSFIVFLICFGCGGYFSKEVIQDIPDKEGKFKIGIIDYLKDQIDKHPKNPALYLELAACLKQEGWPNDALAILNEAIVLDSSNEIGYELRQSYFLSKSRFKDALKDIGHLESRGPISDELKNNKITAYFGQNDFQKFFDIIKFSELELNTRNRSHLSEYYLSQKDTLFAIRYSFKNFKEGTLLPEEQLLLARLLTSKNFIERSLSVLNDTINASPEFRITKAGILLETGKKNEGLNVLKKLANEGFSASIDLLNSYYTKNEIPDSSIYFNDQYLAKYDSSIQILKLQANLYQRKKFWPKAAYFYERILKKDPTDQEAAEELMIVNGKIAYLRRLRVKRDSLSKISN